ncbi:MAG: thiamine/thiamine pyrophosphate ABC transporter permease ThiP [Paracoccaceae bacterium]
MASRIGALIPALLAGGLALFVLAPLLAVAGRATEFALGPADWASVRFTVAQAFLSAVFSVGLAVPVARALARRSFPGRGALITLMGAPFLLPTIVAVLGLVAVFGRSGVINQGLGVIGLGPFSIYGAHGVVLAHVFLNLPLAVRMLLQGWHAIPAERFRLAESLGFLPAETFRHLERPMLRSVAPGAFVVVFVICLTSFAVALTLGGGPGATTVELGIFQAVRFEFDLGRAALLAGVQFALCAVVAVMGWLIVTPAAFGAGLGRAPVLHAPMIGWRLWGDALAIGLAAAFLLVPLGAVVMRGLPGLFDLPASVWAAAGRSVAVALTSTLVTVAASLVLALAVARGRRGAGVMDAVAVLPLATSGLVLGVGLFLMVQPFVSPARLALPVTVAVNAALSLPFVYRLLLPETRVLHADYGRLSASLGIVGVAWLRLVAVPRLARPLGFGAGLAAALSMGDLGVIALFATEQGATLPLVVQRLIGAYRMTAAAGASLLLITMSFALFWVFDAWGRRYAAA